jgi:hypothetical protein
LLKHQSYLSGRSQETSIKSFDLLSLHTAFLTVGCGFFLEQSRHGAEKEGAEFCSVDSPTMYSYSSNHSMKTVEVNSVVKGRTRY